MKKKNLIVFILCISLVLSVLTSCSTKAPEETETQPVSETTEAPKEEILMSEETFGERMLAELQKKFGERMAWGPLGVFDDKVAVYIGGGWTADCKDYEIGPYKFSFGSGGNDICIYHNFSFVSLQTAYELGLVTLDNVKVIHETCMASTDEYVKKHILCDPSGYYSDGKEIDPEFSGILAEPYELSLSNRLDKMVDDAIEKWGEDIYVTGPIGVFDDKLAVLVKSSEARDDITSYKSIKVGEYDFGTYDSEGELRLYIYHDSEFTDILTAYEEGLITADQVKEVNIYYKDFTHQDRRVGRYILYSYKSSQ